MLNASKSGHSASLPLIPPAIPPVQRDLSAGEGVSTCIKGVNNTHEILSKKRSGDTKGLEHNSKTWSSEMEAGRGAASDEQDIEMQRVYTQGRTLQRDFNSEMNRRIRENNLACDSNRKKGGDKNFCKISGAFVVGAIVGGIVTRFSGLNNISCLPKDVECVDTKSELRPVPAKLVVDPGEEDNDFGVSENSLVEEIASRALNDTLKSNNLKIRESGLRELKDKKKLDYKLYKGAVGNTLKICENAREWLIESLNGQDIKDDGKKYLEGKIKEIYQEKMYSNETTMERTQRFFSEVEHKDFSFMTSSPEDVRRIISTLDRVEWFLAGEGERINIYTATYDKQNDTAKEIKPVYSKHVNPSLMPFGKSQIDLVLTDKFFSLCTVDASKLIMSQLIQAINDGDGFFSVPINTECMNGENFDGDVSNVIEQLIKNDNDIHSLKEKFDTSMIVDKEGMTKKFIDTRNFPQKNMTSEEKIGKFEYYYNNNAGFRKEVNRKNADSLASFSIYLANQQFKLKEDTSLVNLEKIRNEYGKNVFDITFDSLTCKEGELSGTACESIVVPRRTSALYKEGSVYFNNEIYIKNLPPNKQVDLTLKKVNGAVGVHGNNWLDIVDFNVKESDVKVRFLTNDGGFAHLTPSPYLKNPWVSFSGYSVTLTEDQNGDEPISDDIQLIDKGE